MMELKDPQHFIPGNTLRVPGMKDARSAADLLAFPGRDPARTSPRRRKGAAPIWGMMMVGGGGAQASRKRDQMRSGTN